MTQNNLLWHILSSKKLQCNTAIFDIFHSYVVIAPWMSNKNSRGNSSHAQGPAEAIDACCSVCSACDEMWQVGVCSELFVFINRWTWLQRGLFVRWMGPCQSQSRGEHNKIIRWCYMLRLCFLSSLVRCFDFFFLLGLCCHIFISEIASFFETLKL